MRATVTAAVLVAIAGPWSGAAAQEGPELVIETAAGTERERSTAAELRELVRRYPVERWIVTRRIVIEQGRIPHSHPVLTLNTRPKDDAEFVATFLHEQFHWLVNERPAARDAAIADFRKLFPDPPSPEHGGARSPESTWLHLIVCDLEYQAVGLLFGERTTRRVLSGYGHYEWVYEQVLDNPEIRRINLRHGLLVP